MFKDVTQTTERSGMTVYRKVVADEKPRYQGSGRKIEEITVHAGGEVFSKMVHGSTHQHATVEEAAAYLGWKRA